MPAYIPRMASAETSVRVSRETLRELERFRELFHAASVDETIRRLVRERRARALDWMASRARGGGTAFSEEDRYDAHD